jgi:hypothetical protein
VVGLDLHRDRTVMVRMSAEGERLDAVRFHNSTEELTTQIAKAGTAPEVVLEATYGWYWAVDALQAAGVRAPGPSAWSQRIRLPAGEEPCGMLPTSPTCYG